MKFQIVTSALPDSIYDTFSTLLGNYLRVIREEELTPKENAEAVCLAWNTAIQQTVVICLKDFPEGPIRAFSEGAQREFFESCFACQLATTLLKDNPEMIENLSYCVRAISDGYIEDNFSSSSDFFKEWALEAQRMSQTLSLRQFSFEKLLLVAKKELPPAKFFSSLFLTGEMKIGFD